jgi:hypothetical protein
VATSPRRIAKVAFATIVALAGLLRIAPAHPAYIQLYKQARRISVNRVVAGVHFPIDAPAGQMLGTTLGEYFLCVSNVLGAACKFREFKPNNLAGNDPSNDYLGEGDVTTAGGGTVGGAVAVAKSDYLEYLRICPAE